MTTALDKQSCTVLIPDPTLHSLFQISMFTESVGDGNKIAPVASTLTSKSSDEYLNAWLASKSFANP